MRSVRREPTAAPAAAPVAVVASIALIGLGIVAGREFLIERNVIDGARWLANTFDWLGRVHWESWMLPAAIGAVVLGVLLLFVAVKPRARTHLPTSGEPVLWLRPTDAARASTAAALHVDGVARAQTTAGRRAVTVRVSGAELHAAPDRDAVHAAVTGRLDAMAAPVKVSVEKLSRR